jgi:hypothetical protein
MRLAPLLLIALCLQLANAYYLSQTRDQLLEYYFANVEGKVPQTARMLIGDERISVYVGSQPMGIETRRGQLYSFELRAIENPTIIVRVSDEAAEKIAHKQMGIMQAISSGGITIEPKTLLSSVKVEMMKRIYAVSGCDDKLLGKKYVSPQPFTYNSIYTMLKARIEG